LNAGLERKLTLIRTPIILVLDDYHVIAAKSIHTSSLSERPFPSERDLG